MDALVDEERGPFVLIPFKFSQSLDGLLLSNHKDGREWHQASIRFRWQTPPAEKRCGQYVSDPPFNSTSHNDPGVSSPNASPDGLRLKKREKKLRRLVSHISLAPTHLSGIKCECSFCRYDGRNRQAHQTDSKGDEGAERGVSKITEADGSAFCDRESPATRVICSCPRC